MQDRFRFRTWHKSTNTMEYNGLWSGRDWDKKLADCNIVIMQCTGIKDKNGKLIYESDIVKIGNGSINGQILEGMHVVKWHVNKWLHCPSWIFNGMDKTHYVEVIGNIYENANMLEG